MNKLSIPYGNLRYQGQPIIVGYHYTELLLWDETFKVLHAPKFGRHLKEKQFDNFTANVFYKPASSIT